MATPVPRQMVHYFSVRSPLRFRSQMHQTDMDVWVSLLVCGSTGRSEAPDHQWRASCRSWLAAMCGQPELRYWRLWQTGPSRRWQLSLGPAGERPRLAHGRVG